MDKKEFYVLNNMYNMSIRRTHVFSDTFLNQVMTDPDILNRVVEKGYADGQFNTITSEGIRALEPYKVSNAVILAAGPSTRFIPLSLEQPKGLFEVKGERLIDRQIEQLHEAGIREITVVLGYKKEMFFYLREKYGVKFIFNSSYNIKNNIESLYLAKEELKNTYICSCDDYFVENPFNQYEYQSFYAGLPVQKKTSEMYVSIDEDGKIVDMRKGMDKGYILLGHSFWKQDFCNKFLSIAEEDREVGMYNNYFWEWLVRDHLGEMPPFYLKKYEANSIFEFDYFDELRKFDDEYIHHTHSRIISNIKSVFHCAESDIIDFRNVSEGMTNTSFIFKIKGVDYIYRHPGEGTESIINRSNEKRSLEIAKKWNIDPTYVYMDVEEGWKISSYIKMFREPDYNDFEDSKKILAVLRELHKMPISVDYGMKPWDDAVAMEMLLLKKNPNCFKAFTALKEDIKTLYFRTVGDGVQKCFCHGDTYKPNWMIEPDGHVILIDWEYSGYSDPGIDVGYYIVDAMYDIETARAFVREYLGDDINEKKEFHFMAYVAIIAYYWFVWAMYRESCGAIMGESLYNWYKMAKKYADYLLKG